MHLKIFKKIIFNKKLLFKKKNILLITNINGLRFSRRSSLTKNTNVKTIYNPIETNMGKKK